MEDLSFLNRWHIHFVVDDEGRIRPLEFLDGQGQPAPAPAMSNEEDDGSSAATEDPEDDEEEIIQPVQVAEDHDEAFNVVANRVPRTWFAMPIDPAPERSECVMYMSRNIYCSANKSSHDSLSSFSGELRGETEPLFINFNLTRCSGSEYFDLHISDVTRPFERHFSLARFQQAELHLQFLNTNQNGTVVVHEESNVSVSLDLYHSKWKAQGAEGTFLHQRQEQRSFSVTCSNVLPASKIQEALQEQPDNFVIVIRINFKLIQGELDVLHGIQKCFYPDKYLNSLRDAMGNALINAGDSDMVMVSGDNVGYGAHRAILAANSDFYNAAFPSGTQEAKSRIFRAPPVVTEKVLGAILKYLYSRNRLDLEDEPRLTMTVLHFAHCYGMNLLVEVCEESLLAMPIERFSLDSCVFVFHLAESLGRAAIEMKIVHILIRKDAKLSSSEAYIKFLHNQPNVAAKMTEMIMQFQNAGSSKK